MSRCSSKVSSGTCRSAFLVLSVIFVTNSVHFSQAFLPSTCNAAWNGVRRADVVSSSQLSAKSGKKKKKVKDNTICVNRQARRNYEIVDTLEAGVVLTGTEVKSIREGKMNIGDGYVRPSKNGRGCTLFNVHISKHSHSAEYFQHEEKAPRPLLVHKEQARRMLQQTERQGMTIVPLKAYFNDQNKVKFEIGLCRGKNVRDKRQDIKARDAKKDAARMVKNFRI